LEAEQALFKIAGETGMEVVIIRSPLVYGPGVKANFRSHMTMVSKGFPLPFGAVTANSRSLVGVDNLVDFILTCISHPAAANQVFLVSDDEDLSTADILHRMYKANGTPDRLFTLPIWFLNFCATTIMRNSVYSRLCGSLQVDISKSKQLLGWKPSVSVDEGLRRAFGKN
jgi:nucleoside-diphosphate-sugar epimerase